MATPKGQAARPRKKKIFLSGPMNSTSDINGQVAISSVLKPRFNVYLAPKDGVEIRTLIDLLANPKVLSPLFLRAALLVQQIGWAHEIYQLLSCDALVLNMDGRVPDEGAVVEAATSYTAGKPVVIYKDIVRHILGFLRQPDGGGAGQHLAGHHRCPQAPGSDHGCVGQRSRDERLRVCTPAEYSGGLRLRCECLGESQAADGGTYKRGQGSSGCIARLEPDMGSMQSFAEALIAGTKARTAARRAFGS